MSLLIMFSTLLGLTATHSVQAASSSTTTTVDYTTTYRGRQYQKQALVYLPAGYSNQQRYNTLYLMHGSTESARDFYRDGNFKAVLDHAISNGQLKPSIVIFPTYYPSRRFVTSDYYRDNRLNRAFAEHELIDELVPAVERRFSTYGQGTSKRKLRASRQHRAFGGFSMGAITTWYVFEHQLDYFASFLPVAGDSWTVEDDGGASATVATAKRLAIVVHGQSFYIFAGVGRGDGTISSMTSQIRAMWRLPQFNHQNLQYYQVPGGSHTPETVARAVQHFIPQLFN